jgi:hypothetical protein
MVHSMGESALAGRASDLAIPVVLLHKRVKVLVILRAWTPERLFGKMNDTIREAVQMAGGRSLSTEALAATAFAGLRELFQYPSR